jgi:hypothetical protein
MENQDSVPVVQKAFLLLDLLKSSEIVLSNEEKVEIKYELFKLLDVNLQ